jgi:N-sulfoglucosamine sulfohydrolase
MKTAMRLILAWVWLGQLSMAEAEAVKPRPNILFCFADDMGRYASIYSKLEGQGGISDLVKTPNLDRVAREGVLFKNAHVCAPSCTPCRSALLSGQYFWRTGRAAILQGAKWDPAIPSFPLLLRDSGYHLGKMYKVWSPGTPADAPYGGQAHAFEKHGRRFNDFSEHVTAMMAKGQSLQSAREELLGEVTANFEDFLAARPKDAPFCFWFGPTNVHRKWVQGSGQALWGLNPDELKGKLPSFLPDVPELREDMASYLGEIMAFDAAVGRLMQRLEQAGELDRTLVVISGDHGAPGFPHGKCNLYDFGTHVSLLVRGAGTTGGRVVEDFVNLMDLAPTFVELGGLKPPSVMTGRSLLPILRSEKSGQVEAGRSFVVTGRERHVESAREGFLPYPQRALRNARFAYIRNFKPERWPMGAPGDGKASAQELADNTHLGFADMDSSPSKAWLMGRGDDPQWAKYFDWAFAKRPLEELYDLGLDAQETRNVAADPKYSATLEQMRGQLLELLAQTKDPRVVEDGKFFETAPMAGPLPKDVLNPRAAARGKGKGKAKGRPLP